MLILQCQYKFHRVVSITRQDHWHILVRVIVNSIQRYKSCNGEK